MMERSAIMTTMGELKLFGMRAAYDEIVATAVKRQHEPQRVVSDLLTAELSGKLARSIKYQIAIARLPLAKDIDDFDFDAAELNETLVRDLAGGGFLEQQRNVVLIGGTGTGKTHTAIAIARACIRRGARGRWSTSSRRRPAPAARAASPIISPASTWSCSTNSDICPSPRPAGSSSSTWSAGSTSRPRSSSPPTSPSASGPAYSATPR
jgi:hypothetical protein